MVDPGAYTPAERAAIARADRKLRKELEQIRDPKLRKECLEAMR